MANFTGSECIICKEKFKDNDDIVVCPECGTPYHRDCYMKEGRCINIKLHEENISWSQKQDEQKETGGKKCSNCNTFNKSHAIICENCGASLVDNLNFGNERQDFNNTNSQNNSHNYNFDGFSFDLHDKYCGLNPEEALGEDVNVSEAADFIDTNTPYYLIHFKRMKETGKKVSLNAICILFPQFYFANRKMWLAAIITILLTTILSVPAWIYTIAYVENSVNIINSLNLQSKGFEIIVQITNYAMMGVRILTCLFSNWLYYRHMLKKIKFIKNSVTDEEFYDDEVQYRIQKSGGTSLLSIFIALAIQAAFFAGVTLILINI